MKIGEFIQQLGNYKTRDTVFNMYRGNSKAVISRKERLKAYLEKHKKAKILLVGEAPGYKGCAKTGVPFTSDNKEISSKIIQDYLTKNYRGLDILIWNAFPFHPHKKGQKNSNRKPNATELFAGKMYLEKLLETFPNLQYFGAIGNTAKKILDEMDLENPPILIRHPAYGGKKKCEEDLDLALNIFDAGIRDDKIMQDVANAATDPEAAYHYLKENKNQFFDWYLSSDHLEYSYAYWLINKIDLDEYKKWPEEITEEDEEYLKKIELDHIYFAKCERDDPFYDSVASPWRMWLKINVHGWKSTVYISHSSPYYSKFDDLMKNSSSFICESEIPEMYGRYIYKRKK